MQRRVSGALRLTLNALGAAENMYTGYFGKAKKYPRELRLVSIARFSRFWIGDRYLVLAPPADIIRLEDAAEYEKQYYESVLNKLDPKKVYEELGDNTVLLCYEKRDDIKSGIKLCHRRLVAEWLESNLGIKVNELEV